MNAFGQKVHTAMTFLEIHPKVSPKLTATFHQPTSQLVFVFLNLLLNCSTLCSLPKNGNRKRGNCQEVQICMGGLDEQTRFSSGIAFSISVIMFSLNGILSAEHRSITVFPKNLLQLQTLRTDRVKR